MHQIVYYSISEKIITEKIISEIIETSRKNNSRKDITGCLLYHDRVFLQLLEGKKEAVNELYEIIKKDERHSNITLIIEEDLTQQIFPNWSMAFSKFHNNMGDMDKFVESIDFFSNSVPKKTEAIDLFWRMAKQIVAK